MRLLLIAAAIPLAFAQTPAKPPEVVRKVEIVWGPELEKSYYIESRRVDVQLEAGEPIALAAPGGVPDNVVRALAKWKFRGADRVSLTVPVRKPITPVLEQSFLRRWRPAKNDLESALKSGAALGSSDAAALQAKLGQTSHDIASRAALLAYAAATGGERARRIREEQLAWLVPNAPDDDILGGPLASINALDDPAAYQRIAQLWIAQIEEHPDNLSVQEHAIQFLKIADPQSADQLIVKAIGKDEAVYRWIGDLYALQMLGVTALDSRTGLPAAAPYRLPETPAAQGIKASLDAPMDARIVLSAIWNLSIDGRALAKAGHLPQGFAELCERLRARAVAMYPETSASCDTSLAIPNVERQSELIAVERTVQQSHRTKFVTPSYPEAAKSRRVQGSVHFQAIIGTDGKIRSLDLISGGFVFYESARSAVLKWVYAPTLLNAKPVEVTAEITVNYRME